MSSDRLTESAYLEHQARRARSAMRAVARDVEHSVTENPRVVDQVNRHPWLSVTGGMVAGIVAGSLLGRLTRGLGSLLAAPIMPGRNGNGRHPAAAGPGLSSFLAGILVPPLREVLTTLVRTIVPPAGDDKTQDHPPRA